MPPETCSLKFDRRIAIKEKTKEYHNFIMQITAQSAGLSPAFDLIDDLTADTQKITRIVFGL